MLQPEIDLEPALDLDLVTAEEAYQAVLWESARLLDLRPAGVQAEEGIVHPVFRAHHVVSDAVLRCPDGVVVLLAAGVAAEQSALDELIAARPVGPVRVVVGGFLAWRDAGMPMSRGGRTVSIRAV